MLNDVPKRLSRSSETTEVDVREDEEQKKKFQDIIDLLLAAGYFRARIKGLSNFDKVIGGMTWCIESCNFDVDIDLLFRENLTIGQKNFIDRKNRSYATQNELSISHRTTSNSRFRLYSYFPRHSVVGKAFHGNSRANGRFCAVVCFKSV